MAVIDRYNFFFLRRDDVLRQFFDLGIFAVGENDAESFGQFALNIPTGDVAAMSEKPATECPHHLIED